jgi:hypothetical protein
MAAVPLYYSETWISKILLEINLVSVFSFEAKLMLSIHRD